MLHFAVQELNAMEEVESQIGLESNTSVQSRNLGSLSFAGEQMQPSLQLIFQQLTLSSIRVQAKINSQCVQLHLRCMGFQVEHPVHGKEGVLQSMSIESGHLQQHRMMSFFQIQATRSKLWHLDIKESALRPGPIASFLRHCNTMESPPNPSYLFGGPQPADDIQHLSREASMENLIELQRYAERISSKQHVFVYGQIAFRIRSWKRLKRSRDGSLE